MDKTKIKVGDNIKVEVPKIGIITAKFLGYYHPGYPSLTKYSKNFSFMEVKFENKVINIYSLSQIISE